MKTKGHIKQYIDKITCWLQENGFEPEVVQQVMRVVISGHAGYTNPVLIFDKDAIRINLYHRVSVSGPRERDRLSKQFETLNIRDASYAYGIGLHDKLLYADLLDVSQTDANNDARLDAFCHRAFIAAPRMLDDIAAEVGSTRSACYSVSLPVGPRQNRDAQ